MNNKNFQGVLFDLDGTLLDTANDLGEALNYVLKSQGLPAVARQHYRPVASDGAKGLLELGFGDKLKQFDYETLRADFLQYYQENIAVHTCLYPEVAELLSALDTSNIPWGIVTNKPEYLANDLVPQFKEFSTCKALLGGDSLPERKPHPAPLLKAAQLINVEPQNCLYVGDAPRDITAGNAAKMTSIIAKWGYIDDHNVLATWQADSIAQSPLAILQATI